MLIFIYTGVSMEKTPRRKSTAKPKQTTPEEPFVKVINIELDPDNLTSGSFELDYNDVFVARLIKAGFKKHESDTDVEIVDRWFQTICKNIAAELQQNPTESDLMMLNSKDVGNGRSEIS